MTDVQISVLVSTRNRANLLARLLNGLAGQIGPPSFEVIVIDNGSRDDTGGVIERARKRLTLHCVREELPGKSRALNAAIKLARGELVVFTDDDVLPQPDWLARLHAAALRYPHLTIFGGRIDVNTEAVPGWVLESFNLMGLLTSAHDKGEKDVHYGYGDYPFGPNMAIRRKLIAGLKAPYPEHMGPGTSLPIGDETRFFMQFSPPESNDRLFVSSARVLHEVEEGNVAFKSAMKRCFLAGRASASLGLPATPQNNHGKSPSVLMVALDRIRTCRTLREFACISARFFGYISARCQSHRERELGLPPTR
jgi:glycosyltransferase involved in cell wall biosynthesis